MESQDGEKIVESGEWRVESQDVVNEVDRGQRTEDSRNGVNKVESGEWRVESQDGVEGTVTRIIELINNPEEMKRMSGEALEWSQQYTLERFEAAIKGLLVPKGVRP